MTALLAATFLLMQLLCQVFATAEGSGCEPPSGYVTFPENNAAYKIHEEPVPWASARDRCIAEGAHLAVITSNEKIEHIVSPAIFESHFFLYLGIHRSATTDEWVRIDNGLPVTSIPWISFTDDIDYNCTAIWRNVGGVITNIDCDDSYAFVCETSLAEGCANPVGDQD